MNLHALLTLVAGGDDRQRYRNTITFLSSEDLFLAELSGARMTVSSPTVLRCFRNLPKGTISFVISVRPSVRLSAQNKSAPTGRILVKFNIRVF